MGISNMCMTPQFVISQFPHSIPVEQGENRRREGGRNEGDEGRENRRRDRGIESII